MIETPQLPHGIPSTNRRVVVRAADVNCRMLHNPFVSRCHWTLVVDADGAALRVRLDALLAQTRGTVSEAARRAGIGRVALLRALRRRDRL